MGNAFAAVALGVPLLAAYLIGQRLPAELFNSTQVLASCLFSCAGLLCLVSWRLVGHARPAYVGSFFVLFGLLTLPLPLITVLLPDVDPTGLLAPLARGSAALPVLFVARCVLRTTEIDAGLRLRRLFAKTAACSVGLYASLVAVFGSVDPRDHTALFIAVEGLVAVGWLAAGGLLLQRARDGQIGMWCGVAVALMGVQAVLRIELLLRAHQWLFEVGTVLLIAAGVAIAGAGSELLAILRHQDRSLLRLSVDLRASESRIEGVRERHEERLHDVRSALAAIRSARGTLHKYAARLDERAKSALEDALTKELSRLEGLVDPTADNPLVTFDLREALAPVIAAECSQGSEIMTSLPRNRAYGRPSDTAAVVQNLIVNARRYAPSSVVVISASQRGGRILLQVEDSGPGIPARERAAIFERGVRGSTSEGVPGTGLGLYVSSRLMAEQHGALRLREGAAGGACFVLDLPAAEPDTDLTIPAPLTPGHRETPTGQAIQGLRAEARG